MVCQAERVKTLFIALYKVFCFVLFSNEMVLIFFPFPSAEAFLLSIHTTCMDK